MKVSEIERIEILKDFVCVCICGILFSCTAEQLLLFPLVYDIESAVVDLAHERSKLNINTQYIICLYAFIRKFFFLFCHDTAVSRTDASSGNERTQKKNALDNIP